LDSGVRNASCSTSNAYINEGFELKHCLQYDSSCNRLVFPGLVRRVVSTLTERSVATIRKSVWDCLKKHSGGRTMKPSVDEVSYLSLWGAIGIFGLAVTCNLSPTLWIHECRHKLYGVVKSRRGCSRGRPIQLRVA
jgi:hypothetical protein